MTIVPIDPLPNDNFDWLTSSIRWPIAEAFSDFMLLRRADRTPEREDYPFWQLMGRDGGQLVPRPSHGAIGYALLENLIVRFGISPVYKQMRRIHVRPDAIFIAPLENGVPAGWVMTYPERATAHEIMEAAELFRQDHCI